MDSDVPQEEQGMRASCVCVVDGARLKMRVRTGAVRETGRLRNWVSWDGEWGGGIGRRRQVGVRSRGRGGGQGDEMGEGGAGEGGAGVGWGRGGRGVTGGVSGGRQAGARACWGLPEKLLGNSRRTCLHTLRRQAFLQPLAFRISNTPRARCALGATGTRAAAETPFSCLDCELYLTVLSVSVGLQKRH